MGTLAVARGWPVTHRQVPPPFVGGARLFRDAGPRAGGTVQYATSAMPSSRSIDRTTRTATGPPRRELSTGRARVVGLSGRKFSISPESQASPGVVGR